MARLGFIGLGMMGAPMAQSLLRAGHELLVYDVSREPVERLAAAGAAAAASPAALAGCDCVFVIVKTGAQVEDVVLGAGGLLSGMAPGRTLTCAVMSTIAPPLIRELAAAARPRGLTLLDAPVSGGPILAQMGLLTFMVGGGEGEFEQVRPYLAAMGSTIFPAGPLGAGLTMKLVNNLVGITNAYVFTEAMRIADAGGLDLGATVAVINASSGRNWCSENWEMYVKFVGLVLQDESFHATAVKDIETAMSWAAGLGLESPVMQASLEIARTWIQLPEETYARMAAAKPGV